MKYVLPAGTLVRVSSWNMPRICVRAHTTKRDLTFTACVHEGQSEYCFHEGDWYIQARKETVRVEA